MAHDLPPRSSVTGGEAERLWRVRKQHRHIDAMLLILAEAQAVELRYFRDDRLLFAHRWPDRQPAVAAAAATLQDLLLAGWTTHW